MQWTAYYTPGLWRFQSHYLGHSKGNDFFLEMGSRIFAWSTNGHSSYSNSCSKLHLQHFGFAFSTTSFCRLFLESPLPCLCHSPTLTLSSTPRDERNIFLFWRLEPWSPPSSCLVTELLEVGCRQQTLRAWSPQDFLVPSHAWELLLWIPNCSFLVCSLILLTDDPVWHPEEGCMRVNFLRLFIFNVFFFCFFFF